MSPGELVTVHLTGPREKFWGVLLSLSPAGATVRGVPLESFEDFLRQAGRAEAPLIGPVTAYFPAHRIDRVELDESSGAVEGLGARYRRVTGCDPHGAVLGDEPSIGN